MKQRKKLTEMTPEEWVNRQLKGMSWERAESIGIEILARCYAKHMHVDKDIDTYNTHISRRLMGRTYLWARANSTLLAMAAVSKRYEDESSAKHD